MEDLKEVLSTFVMIAGTIDYGSKLIRWLIKKYKEFKKPRRFKKK